MTTNTTPAPVAGAAAQPAAKSMDDIVALCKRRGFIYPASEIYGGINGFWDFGPLGTEIKNNLRDAWWNDMVKSPPVGPDGEPLAILGVDSAIIQHPKTWEASGHVAGFNDPMVDCKHCKGRFREDQVFVLFFRKKPPTERLLADLPEKYSEIDAEIAHLVEQGIPREDAESSPQVQALKRAAVLGDIAPDLLKSVVANNEEEAKQIGALTKREKKVFAAVDPYMVTPLSMYRVVQKLVFPPAPCPNCGANGTLTEPRLFNLMFKTFVGATSGEENVAYLRPETAQGIFLNYRNVLDTMRVKVPFGIAQIGKAFRNEVTPRNFIFRSREFEQMEIEFFCHPDDARKWYEFWCEVRKNWWMNLGLTGDNLQMRAHENEELAHYAKEGCGCFDIEYRFPFTAPGFGELEGVADRTDFDLRQHQECSGAKLEYFDQERNERYIPHVIEPSGGLSRGVLALICEAFTPTPERKGSKYVMRFDQRMAPIQAAVFPLVNKDGMPEIARRLYDDLRTKYATQFDVKQSIGKRYARMDEAGTPYCFTIDSDTLQDQTVTVRERDTAAQERINIDKVAEYLRERMQF